MTTGALIIWVFAVSCGLVAIPFIRMAARLMIGGKIMTGLILLTASLLFSAYAIGVLIILIGSIAQE